MELAERLAQDELLTAQTKSLSCHCLHGEGGLVHSRQRDCELAFAMGQHERLGHHSMVVLIEHGLIRAILRKEKRINAASELSELAHFWTPERACAVTLHLEVCPGRYHLQTPLLFAEQICMAPQVNCREGGVQFVDTPDLQGTCLLSARGPSAVVSVEGISFILSHGPRTGYTMEQNRSFDPCKGQAAAQTENGGYLALQNCSIHCSKGVGTLARDGQSRVVMKGCEMFRCGFAGAATALGGHTHAVSSTVQWSQCAGFLSKDEGSTMVVQDCTSQFNGTNGVCALTGSTVSLTRSVLSRNVFSGAVAHGNGSYLSMSDCQSTENQHCGASALEMGSLYAQKSFLRHSGQAGALATGEGSMLSLLECSADDNLRHGLEARSGAMMIASKTRARNNGDAGSVAGGASSVTFLQDCIVSSNARDGCRAEEGAQVQLIRSLVSRSSGSGVVGVGAESRLTVRGGEVTGNEQDGIGVWEGAEGFAEGCVVELNAQAGVRCVSPGSKVTVVNALLKRNKVAVAASLAGHAQLRGCEHPTGQHPLANDRDYLVESYGSLHTDDKGLASI